jgi:hypothetical protein
MPELLQKDSLDYIHEYNSNLKWFLSNYDSINQNYKGKSVAIDNNQVIDSDEDMNNLIDRMRKRYAEKIRAILIQYVPEKEYPLTV